MNRRRAACLVPVVAVAIGSAARADVGPESTALPFLNLGSGPRIEALGGAGTAISEGVDAAGFFRLVRAGSDPPVRTAAGREKKREAESRERY